MADCYICIHKGACSDAGDPGISYLKEDAPYCKHFRNKEDVEEALEKQTPQKPFVPWDSINKTPICPSCQFGVVATQKYCDECGQKLDWGDSDE